MMEEHLQKLVEHAKPKPTFSIIVSGKSSRVQTHFNPPLVFPDVPSCYYEMALMRLVPSTANCSVSSSMLVVKKTR